MTSLDRDRAQTPAMRPLRWYALGAVVLAAVGAIGLYVLLAELVHIKPWPKAPTAAQQQLLIDMVKIALGLTAGVGAAVALIVGYRRARVDESASHRDDQRLFSSRYQDAADLIGSDKAAVRLAGIYAMARLADDWESQRQQCIDVLCAYLRLPYPSSAPPEVKPIRTKLAGYRSSPGIDPDGPTREPGEREVRRTVLRLITAHLHPSAPESRRWHGYDLDFTDAVFDGADFRGVHFSSGALVLFRRALFASGFVDFGEATFAGGVDFTEASFAGGTVDFGKATFSGGDVSFIGATFANSSDDRAVVSFRRAKFAGGTIHFDAAEFAGSVDFHEAMFSGSTVNFSTARFSTGTASFGGARFFGGTVNFSYALLSGGTIDFGHANPASPTEIHGGNVSFVGARLDAGTVDFADTIFSRGTVDLGAVEFLGGTMDLSDVRIEPGYPLETFPDPTAGLELPSRPTPDASSASAASPAVSPPRRASTSRRGPAD
ncbi:pentapeptide repeat-containing protein [Kribbella sp. NPDC049584]|uniref:pentapeptide repeat-containing protein n=1 Tax=Kribbella sp. NPDC049584 TaxID=3154833 RepID=UPI00341EBB22